MRLSWRQKALAPRGDLLYNERTEAPMIVLNRALRGTSQLSGRLASRITGCSAVGSAGGLGACNTPNPPEKSEIPKSFVKPQFFAPPHLAKSLEHGPLTTCLTTTAEA